MPPIHVPLKLQESYLDHPSDRIVSAKEILTKMLNFERVKLLERASILHEAHLRFEENPGETTKTASGDMTISAIYNQRTFGVREAVNRVRALERMLADVKEGDFFDLGKYWNEKTLEARSYEEPPVPSNLSDYDSEDGEEKGE